MKRAGLLFVLLCMAALVGCGKLERSPQTYTVLDWIKKLKDPNPERRSQAAIALHRPGAHVKEAVAAVPVLVKLLKDSDAMIRQSAAEALRHVGPGARDAVPALLECLKDQEVWVRVKAAEALWKIDQRADEVVAVLIEVLEHADSISQEVPDSVSVASHPPDDPFDLLSQRVVLSLGQMGAQAKAVVPVLEKLANAENRVVREVAREALEKILSASLADDKEEGSFTTALPSP